jgi:hypothetical protein
VRKVEHTKYIEALELAYAHVSYAEPGTMVLIVGMSGAGKGYIANEIKARLSAGISTAGNWEMPILELISRNADNSFYSSKDTASRLLNELRDPFHSEDRGRVLDELGIKSGPTSHRTMSESSIRQKVHRLLKGRAVRYIFVDEADMMCVAKKSGRDEADHLEGWRLLALDAGVVVVFLAGYRMLRIWDRTSQFTRKMPTVHVAPYRVESDEDVEDFVALIQEMNDFHQVSKQQSARIIGHAAAIIAATGGIFGQLKGLYERADDRALSKGKPALELSDIVFALPKRRQVSRLWEEVALGESALESIELDELERLAKRHQKSRRSVPDGGAAPEQILDPNVLAQASGSKVGPDAETSREASKSRAKSRPRAKVRRA